MKKVLIALAAVVGVLFFGNALLAGPVEETPVDYSASFEMGEERVPSVAAPISRPFALPIVGGAEQVDGGGDIYGNAVESTEAPAASATAESGEEGTGGAATDELQRADSYQSAVTLTQNVAAAYGTYSPDQTAQEWVDSLPGLEDSARAQLLESAAATWPQLVDRQSSSVATVSAQSVTPIYSRDGGATIQLSVTVTKETSYEGVAGFETDSYAVTLKRDSEVSSGWTVIAVQ